MLETLEKLFRYDEWAIGRSLDSLEDLTDSKALELLSHILLSEKIWLVRLKGEDSSQIPKDRQISFAECLEMTAELHRAYLEFLDSLVEADLENLITYKNTKGIEFQTSIKDILLHVAMHGIYHRGQIALLVRGGGGQAVNTDYITFTRL